MPELPKQVERVDDLVEAARAIAPILREHADFAEREGLLADEVVRAMQRAGAFRMTMPRSLGGIEADPVTQYEVIEALSVADGSAGWVAMIGSDGGYLAGQHGDELGRDLYPDPDLLTSGAFAPTGRAERVAGGVRVSGRWSFASCCRHAAWFGGTCITTRDGEPVLADGHPDIVRAMLPISEVEILDTWHTTG